MKITKINYNELRTQELDNNFAKVWHVNEIREELLANSGNGGVTTLSDGSTSVAGEVVFQTATTNITATVDEVQNSINFNYTLPYQEIVFNVSATGGSGISTTMYYSSIQDLTYTPEVNEVTMNLKLTPTTDTPCNNISVQLSMNQQYGTTDYIEIPHIIDVNTTTGVIIIGIDRNTLGGNTITETGLKSSIEVTVKLFGYAI